VAALPRVASAQLLRDSSTAWLTSAASETERYVRVLQIIGISTPTPWTIRPFSSSALTRLVPRDSVHPWARALMPTPAGHRVRILQPELTAVVNSRFPFGLNDGPVWAGRGLTTAVSFGVQAHLGPLELTLAPQLFRAENASFPLAPNGFAGPRAFADVGARAGIDLPQRFGDDAYQQLDPGQSVVQLHAGPVAIGVSTANEMWGPAVESPFLLGANAAGFLHAFAGTERPVTLGPLSAGLRVIVGRLDQSDYSLAPASQRRVLSGAIATVGLRELPGLEIGVARLFENVWPDSGLSVGDVLGQLLKNPLKVYISAGIAGSEPDNQIASLFARWSFPASGVEVYGELGREDNSHDVRDLLLEPDHDLAYLVGVQRAWRRPRNELLVLRAELLNSSITHLDRVREQAPAYVHTRALQGHTQRGQVLGAPSGYGGGGSTVALEWLTPNGRRTVTWRRLLREPAFPPAPRDVMHAVTLDWLFFRPRLDLAPEATLVYNLNRDAGGDPINLRGALTTRLHW
jgi:hypothetical protein